MILLEAKAVMCSMLMLGGLGHAPRKIDALRLNLRAFQGQNIV